MVKVLSDIPIPTPERQGFPKVLREMCKGDSFEIPQEKRGSVYVAARTAGVKITIRNVSEKTARVWRTDGRARGDIFGDGTNIFGDPIEQ